MRRILIVEDNQHINNLIAQALQKEGYEVHQTYNAVDALKVFHTVSPDCVITDLMLPIMSGEELIEEIRGKSQVHIIIISAKTSVTEKLEGLRIGADDYLYKPFIAEEIVYKLENLFKKMKNDNVPLFDNGIIQFFEGQNQIIIQNNAIQLTSVEYRMMKFMIEHPKQVISREQFINMLYSYGDDVYDRVIDVHIKNIRQKIKPYATQPIIKTIYGLGYSFVGDDYE